MNQNDLKKLLKPLVKQLVKEAMQEELSTVITEIIKQTGGKTVVETKQSVVNEQLHKEKQIQKEKINNERRKVLEELSKNSYGGINIFEGTNPLNEGGKVKESNGGAPKTPLSDVDPSDPGVDISGLLRMTGGWKKI